MPQPLYLPYPLNKRLGGSYYLSGVFGRENLLPLKLVMKNSLLLKKQQPTEINEPRKILLFMKH
jgi:hypothetical protein